MIARRTKVMRRQSTFVFHHASHPWSKNKVLIWMLRLGSIKRSDYLALRFGFVTYHKLPHSYDFHKYIVRSMEDDYNGTIGIRRSVSATDVLTWIERFQFKYSYTKALEVIKKLHKDQAQEIKTFRLKLENLQTVKDQAYKKTMRTACWMLLVLKLFACRPFGKVSACLLTGLYEQMEEFGSFSSLTPYDFSTLETCA